MIRTLAIVGLLAIPAGASDFNLEAKWKVTIQQTWSCDKPAPVSVESFSFEIQDAPLLNRSMSSYSYNDANVRGAVTIRLKPQSSSPQSPLSGLLIGAIVKNAKLANGAKAKPDSLTLQGYIVSQQAYGEWVQNGNRGRVPSDAGEVELEVLGSALQGYTLSGVVRSGQVCPDTQSVAPMFRDTLGKFGSGAPSTWSLHVTMQKQ